MNIKLDSFAKKESNTVITKKMQCLNVGCAKWNGLKQNLKMSPYKTDPSKIENKVLRSKSCLY